MFQNGADVREMIKRKIQEESLQTYLFVYSSVYDSISLGQLAEMFELDRATIHSIISKMIINEELMVRFLCHTHIIAVGSRYLILVFNQLLALELDRLCGVELYKFIACKICESNVYLL